MARAEPDRQVAIVLRLHEGDVGTTSPIVTEDHIEIAGRPTTVWELESGGGEGWVLPPGTRIYQYIIQLGPVAEAGPNLSATTSSISEHYPGSKSVLDDLMESLEIERPGD